MTMSNQNSGSNTLFQGKIDFLADGTHVLQGRLLAGSSLSLTYDPARLPQIRPVRGACQDWDIEVGLIFHPGREFYIESIFDKPGYPPARILKTLQFPIPPSSKAVEIWFRNFRLTHLWEQYDSVYGKNYWFEICSG